MVVIKKFFLVIKDFIEQVSNALQIKKCIVCSGVIMGTYHYDAWGQSAHVSCAVDNCFCCVRIVSSKGKKLTDGRSICEVCKDLIVKNSADINWVDERVLAVLNSVGIIGLPKTPIEIVNKHQLSQLMTNTSSFGDSFGLAKYVSVGSNKQFNIYILDNLPKTFFAGILAHEYMHVWQYQHNINPPKDICEGFCNLGAMAMYQKINTKFSTVLLEQMEKSPDPVYGEGYRKVSSYWQKHQWPATIQKMYTYK